MQNLVSEISKYLILILITMYAYVGFTSFLKKEKKEVFFVFPSIILLFHATGFLSIYLKVSKIEVAILYFSQVLLFLVFTLLYTFLYKNFSKALFYHMFFLLMIGFVFVTRISLKAGIKQTVFAALALTGSLSLPFLIKKMKFLRNMGSLYAGIGIGTLVFVLFNASRIYGAKNWVSLFGFYVQPSEFVKIVLIFMIASFLYVSKSIQQQIRITCFTATMVILLVLERDLGAGLLFYVTFVVMMYYSTGNRVFLALNALGGVFASIIGYFLFSHVRVRMIAFLDPWKYIDDKGYQITQSLFGIGTGGWFGFGLYNGSPKSTPVVESDFIFSGLAEEFGVLFGLALILIYLSTFFILLFLSYKTKNEFHRNISVGCLTLYSFQVLLSIGGSIKFIPSTGVTLPFISTGGSSMMSMVILFSIIQGLYIASHEEEKTGYRIIPNKLNYVLVSLYASMMLYLVYFQCFTSKEIMNNAYNKRLDLYASTVVRGKIYSADGVLLADTKELKNGKSKRVYPFKNLYSQVVGRNEKGKTGIEAMMNYELFTSNDDVLKRISERVTGVKNKGNSVITTIDSKLQTSLHKALGNRVGAGVILEPDTGKILALVSKPDYNPNRTNEEWERLVDLEKHREALVNRATTGLYPPGSTFKVLTELYYLKHSLDDEAFSYDCKGIFQEKGSEVQCFNKVSHKKVDLKTAFALSCNGAFAKIGLESDKKAFVETARDLLFNKELPFPIATLNSSFSLGESAQADEVMQTAIGQGKTQITPVHNALIAATIANDGVLMKPYLVNKITSYDGKREVKTFRSKVYRTLIPEKENAFLKESMKETVRIGTAKKLSSLGYPIYGKTGTAEYMSEKGSLESHSWFIGFAEKNRKKIAISILLEGETRGKASGVDIAYQVFENWK